MLCKWIRSLLVASFLLSVLLSACGDSSSPILVGALYNLTGDQSSLDTPSAQGARLAVEMINRQGGVLERPLQLLLKNGQTSPSVITVETTSLLANHPSLVALMGLSDTDMVMAAAPTAAAQQRVFVTSGATSPRLPEAVPEYLFLACFGDNVQAAAGAEWAHQALSAHTVSVLYNADMEYTRLLHQYFQTRFEELGGVVLSVQSYSSTDDVNTLKQTIADLAAADLIYLASSPSDDLKLVRLLQEKGVPILGGDSLDSEGLWQKQPDIKNVYYTTHAYLGADNSNSMVQAFRQNYIDTYGVAPNAFAALGYDTVYLLASAIERANSDDPDSVRLALSRTKDFRGVSGPISYVDGSRIPIKSVSIVEANRGTVRLVTEWLAARVPPPSEDRE